MNIKTLEKKLLDNINIQLYNKSQRLKHAGLRNSNAIRRIK